MHSKTTGHHSIPWRELTRFLAVTFAVGMALQVVAVRVGLATGGMLWLGLTMWAPTLGVLLAGPQTRARAWSAIRVGAWRWWPVGFAIGAAPRLLQTAVLALTGQGRWQGERFTLTPAGDAIEGIHGVGMMLGVGPQSFAFLALNLALTLTVSAVVVAAIGGIGEEIGWRGALQPALEERLRPRRATVVVGLVWAFWHLPANLAGYNDATHPVLGALLVFPIVVVAMSISFAWLRQRSGSVWPVAVAHGANNTLGSALLLEAPGWAVSTALDVASIVIVAAFISWLDRRNSAATHAPRPTTCAATAPRSAPLCRHR